MADTIIEQIRKIRDESDFEIDRKNNNRYSVIVKEKDGTNTAYCFGGPIYNQNTRKIVSPSFTRSESGLSYFGSNTDIKINRDGLYFRRNDGVDLKVDISCTSMYYTEDKISTHNFEITPTLNGLMLSVPISESPVRFKISSNKPYLQIRQNTKFFALMEETYLPIAVVSATGETDADGNVCAPAAISCLMDDVGGYTISVKPTENRGENLLIEIDMYEPKMYQDTTVESSKLKENNSFGTVGFLGLSEYCGEQWLYTRPDVTKIPFLLDYCIHSVSMYVPNLGKVKGGLEMYRTLQRFCSFGSSWDNKVSLSNKICDSRSQGKYEVFDLTPVLSDKRTGMLMRTDGLLIRTNNNTSGCITIATGDSLYKPQILAFNFS